MKTVTTDADMKKLGAQLGALVRGGELIELVGDVGAGKTTLTKGIAEGLDVDEEVQSPSFTISREYPARDGLELHHYDFYRLSDPGVVKYELAESVTNPQAITVMEWGETTHDVLPPERVIITISYGENESRQLQIDIPTTYGYLEETL